MPRNLVEYLELSAARAPRSTAVVESGGRTITYEDLNRQADGLAGFLVQRGVGRGDRVGVVLPKGIPAVVSLFGVMKAGAAYVPVDWTSPTERGRRILTDCQVTAVIVDGRATAVVPEAGAGDAEPATVVVFGDRSGAGHSWTAFDRAIESPASATGPRDAPGPSDLAYVLYTSGSTGLPKGAMISHGNAVSFVEWCSSEFALTPEDRVTSNAPFHFDLSVLDVYVTVKHGATLYLISEDLGRNAHELARFVAANRLTVWTSTPSVLMLLVQYGNLPAHDATSLRLVLFGGEVFPARQLRELRRRWTSPAFYNLYGPTEITTACTFARLPDAIPDDRDAPYPIGFPCPHCQALVLDEHGHPAPPGEEGLLFISGVSVFRGYWNRPAENAAAFLDRDGVRWYNTGDVVRFDPIEGFSYVGRRDRMVKRRGFRIEMGEIESALHAHERVVEAAAVAVPDPTAGVRIIAFVACHGPRPSGLDLKAFCGTKIPAYMTPDRFLFRDRLPRTSTEKIDYQVLAGEAAEQSRIGA